ncbi:UNKNOWN [Stylonychia lemnae]|uniref:Transmembrane protein n=1 Tax=Stylonychia lemnae TaxID=5949 RepID=A0A078API2_STYLE|nr:UNKNOWN [Stylonychia lemnae]|eukprot:CDW82843.1 UNKNOWN [Stylonychia lemnae]
MPSKNSKNQPELKSKDSFESDRSNTKSIRIGANLTQNDFNDAELASTNEKVDIKSSSYCLNESEVVGSEDVDKEKQYALNESQKWTMRYGLSVLAISIVMIIYGLVNVVQEFKDIIKIDSLDKKKSLEFKGQVPQKQEESNDMEDFDNTRSQQVKFLYDMITFVFLQGISLLMHSLTLIQGIFGLFQATQSLIHLKKIKSNGNNPRFLKTLQEKTNKISEYINCLILMQISSSVAYSVVYIVIIQKAYWRFEEEKINNENIEKQILDYQSVVSVRCAIIISFYLVGCLFSLLVFGRFKHHQKMYEDNIRGQKHSHEQSKFLENNKIGCTSIQIDE